MQLAKVSTTEESLLSKVANRDRKIGHLEEKLAELADGRGRRSETVSVCLGGVRVGVCVRYIYVL